MTQSQLRSWMRRQTLQLQRRYSGNEALLYAEAPIERNRAFVTYKRGEEGTADVTRLKVEYLEGSHAVTAEHVVIILPDRYWSPTATWFQVRAIEVTTIRVQYAELTLEFWWREEYTRWMLRLTWGQCCAATPKEVVHANDAVRLHFHVPSRPRVPVRV